MKTPDKSEVFLSSLSQHTRPNESLYSQDARTSILNQTCYLLCGGVEYRDHLQVNCMCLVIYDPVSIVCVCWWDQVSGGKSAPTMSLCLQLELF